MSRYAHLRAENARLRAALEENFVVEMTYSNEADDPTVYSEGWACAHCDLGDGCADRPYADEKALVTHVASCPLYCSAGQAPSVAESKEGK